MSARAVIDSLEFARSEQQLHGTVPVAELSRLGDGLFDAGGELRYEVSGGLDERQRPRLNLAVEGSLHLRCQRCLGSLDYPVAVRTSLLVLTAQMEGDGGDLDELDGIPADAHTDVWSMVEDEILLAIPLSPRHADTECRAAVTTASGRAASPFAVLARLKQH